MLDSLRDVDVLVTGASGFLGSHLTRRLVAEGAKVHAFIRPDSDRERVSDIIATVRVWPGDLRDQASVDRSVEGARPRVVYHAAGFTRGREWQDAAAPELLEHSFDVNVTGTMRLLVAARRHAPDARIIRIGGLEEYGCGDLPYREPQREAPTSAYSASQVAATHLAEMFHRRLGMATVTLRPELIYGPRQSTTFFIPALIHACLANEPFEITAADHTRDFVYVDDVVEAGIRTALTSGVEGEIINVGSGQEHRVNHIARLVATLTGSHAGIRIADRGRRPTDLPRLVCDPSRARDLLGWHAGTPTEVGLDRTIAWYRHARRSDDSDTPGG